MPADRQKAEIHLDHLLSPAQSMTASTLSLERTYLGQELVDN
jgi:hypothetical protein